MMGLGFLVEKKILARLKWKTKFALTCIVMKTSWFFQSTFQIKNLKARWNCCSPLMKTSHITCISRFWQIYVSQNKKYFCKSCLQCFRSKNMLTEHKEDCLSINGTQSLRLEKGTIEFKKYFKEIPVPFKFYADF